MKKIILILMLLLLVACAPVIEENITTGSNDKKDSVKFSYTGWHELSFIDGNITNSVWLNHPTIIISKSNNNIKTFRIIAREANKINWEKQDFDLDMKFELTKNVSFYMDGKQIK